MCVDLGAAPAVDRLVVVAHHAQVAMAGGQGLDDAVLAAVGVLVLVDQQVVEPAGLLAPHVGVLANSSSVQSSRSSKSTAPAAFSAF